MKQRFAAAMMKPDARRQLQATDWDDAGIRPAGTAAWKARHHRLQHLRTTAADVNNRLKRLRRQAIKASPGPE